MLIVFTTCGSKIEADGLAHQAIEQKLAACVQILPAIDSVYEWKGKIVTDKECLLLFKTNQKKYPDLKEFIEKTHSYEVPEIIAVPSERVSAEYAAWMKGVLG